MPGYRLDGLKAARQSAGMTQDALARATALSLSTIQRLELPSVTRPYTVLGHHADRIAAALGTDYTGLSAVWMD